MTLAERRQKIEAEARKFVRHWYGAPDNNPAHSAALRDLISRLVDEAVAERDKELLAQIQGAASRKAEELIAALDASEKAE